MELLLIILRMLGIVFACIIALLLILILLVLFVPIRYKYKFKYNDEKDNENCHYVDLTWIFKIVKLRVYISLAGVDYEFRVFGIRSRFIEKLIKKNSIDVDDGYEDDLYEENFWEEDETRNNDYSYEESIIPNAKDYDELNDINSYSKECNSDNCDSMAAKDINNRIISEEIVEDDLENINLQDYIEEDKKNTFIKLFYVFRRKIYNIFNKIRCKIKYLKEKITMYLKKLKNVLNPCKWLKIVSNKLMNAIRYIFNLIRKVVASIKSLIHRVNLIIEFLDRPSTIRGIDKAKEYIIITCKHILPRKKKIALCVGFDDPSQTGQLLAIAGTMYPIFGQSIEIYPNFADKEFKVDCLLQGRIRGVNVIIIVFKVMKDKAIKRLIYNLNKLKEELENVR